MNGAEQSDTLVSRCGALRRAASRAVDWVGDVEGRSPVIRQNAPALVRTLRRIENASRRLGRAAGRRMALGVFGPSQAGKSYLVNSLCQKDAAAFLVRLGDEEFDFLRQINPQNEGESTGLVTRFSTELAEAPAGYPVHLRLLTEMDLVKILLNACQEDILHDENDDFSLPDGHTIVETLDRLRGMVGAPGMAAHIADGDVHDLAEYVNDRYQKRYREVAAAGFWDHAAELAPRLPIEGRIELFSLLWGANSDFTCLFERLSRAAAALGNAEDIHCGLDAFVECKNGVWVRRPDSLLNVQTLAGIGSEGGAVITVLLPDGRTVELARSMLSALTAELVLRIGSDAYPFFRHADLLDFPGVRARLRARSFKEGAKSGGEDIANPGANFLLRGKVETLFQRYEAEREMTGMLLCIPNGNIEVPVLGDMVNSWVNKTLGATPTARTATPNILFFIMTKFDREFEQSTGQDEDSQKSRWNNRIQEGLLSLWERYGWPVDWDGKPFTNSFFLRNPSFRNPSLMTYGADEDETGLNTNQEAFINRMRQYCLESALIRKHVVDPGAAFDAALSLGDGGVSYLVDRITTLCDQELKLQQIQARLEDLRADFAGALVQFFDDERHDKRAERTQAAETVGRALMKSARSGDFCQLLDALMLTLDEIRMIHANISALSDDGTNDKEEAKELAADDDFDPFAGPAEQAAVAPVARLTRAGCTDRAGRFVQAVIACWTEQLSELAMDQAAQRRFQLSYEEFRGLNQELVRGIGPLGVDERMAEAVRHETSHANAQWEVVAPRACLIAHRHLANYVAWLGHDRLPMAERADVPLKNPTRKAFETPKPVNGLPDLPETVPPSTQPDPSTLDWVHVLRHIAAEHAGVATGGILSSDDNAALGQLLSEARVG